MLSSFRGRKAQQPKKRFRLESLEEKAMLAGDVAASLVNGDLFLTGDAADNQFEIVRDVTQATPGAGEVTVRGLLGTTINGLAEVTFNGADAVTGDLNVDLSAGGIDTVTIGETASTTPLVLLDDIRVNAGATGSQTVQVLNVDLADDLLHTSLAADVSVIDVIGSSIGGDARVDSVANQTIFTLDASSVGGDAELSTVGGLDSLLDALDTTIGNNLALTASSTISEIAFAGITVGNDVVINVTGEENTVDIASSVLNGRNTIGDDFRFTGGAGIDGFSFLETDIVDDLRINTGDGENLGEFADFTVGDDFVLVDGDNGLGFSEFVIAEATIGDDVYYSGNGGRDLVGFEFVTIGDNFRASGGNGEDEVFLVDSTVADSVLISLGQGFDQTEVENVNIGRDLAVLGLDDNFVFFQNVVAIQSATVLTSGGQDEVIFRNVDTHFALIATAAGVDNVFVGSSQITGQPPELSEIDLLFVFLGAGDDTLTLDGVDSTLALLNGGSGTDTLVDVEDANDITFDIDFAFENFQVA